MRRFFALLGACCWLLACSVTFAAVRPAGNNLERVFAEQRRAQVRSVAYALHFTFTKGSQQYGGEARITTELADITRPLSLDWLGKAPLTLSVNGQVINDYTQQVGSIDIPAKYLQPKTEIFVRFINGFSTQGEGLQRVVDAQDQQEYIYTDFEPYRAHELFPCFDQPDLKARFDVSLTVPSDWKAISNELPHERRDEDGQQTTRFKTTPLLSPYLLFVGAGPFAQWQTRGSREPLFIYARQSLAKYVDAGNLFATTKKGLDFYRRYFGYDYPFSKVALVFVPELISGGMENPGAITLNERNLFRGAVPQSRRLGRDELILHELAHMWFGNLVTMRWWNDLWLNESFATYIATLAQERALQSHSAWLDFNSTKSWAYWQDQLVTTHPIETAVNDVRFARANFDGITYAKGGAALQQLHFSVGEDAFRSGLQAYFRQHAFGNAERADFIAAISHAAQKDLDPWTSAWLHSAGPNRVSAHWSCAPTTSGSRLAALTIEQEASSSGTLSPHRSRIGIFKRDGEALQLLRTIDVDYSQASTALDAAALDLPCPDFVYPNLEDKDYALVTIDAASMQQVPALLGGAVADPLLRLQVWGSLAQMVRDARLTPARYLELATAALAREGDAGVLAVLLKRHSALKQIWNDYLSVPERAELAGTLEATLWSRITAAQTAAGEAMSLFDFYLQLVQSSAGVNALHSLLASNSPPAGIALDQERRWHVIQALARNGWPDAPALIAAEQRRDPSSTGQQSALTARVALPSLAAKQEFWNTIATPDALARTTLQTGASAFHQPNQPELVGAFVDQFFSRVTNIDWNENDQLVKVYFDHLFPRALCSAALLAQSTAALQAASLLTPLARRAWLEANDELARCVKVTAAQR